MFSSRIQWNLNPNRLTQMLAEKRGCGARIFDLTESNPTRAGFDYSSEEILSALSQAMALIYEPTPRGLLIAREAIADYYTERSHTVNSEQIHLTASTSESYSYLFKLLADYGDEVLAPQPSYPLFEFLAAFEGIILRPYQLTYTHPTGWRIDWDSLDSALTSRTRAVILVNPNNPTGSFIKPDERDQLLAFCANRNLALIVDEVFGDYAWNGDIRGGFSFVSTNEVLTFVLSGLSKSIGLPQMKLGWIVASGPCALRCEAQERLDLIADTYLSVSAPVQYAAQAWLKLRFDLQQQILNRTRTNFALLSRLTEGSPCRLLITEGGWSTILEIPRQFTEEEWVLELLLKDEVLVHPGYFFDFAREAFLVLSLLPPTSIFHEGVERIIVRIGRS